MLRRIPLCHGLLIPCPIRLNHLFIPQPPAPIPNALSQQHDICHRIIHRQDRHRRQHALQNRAQDIEDIASKPYDDEEEGKAIGRGATEVFDDLRREDNDPAGD